MQRGIWRPLGGFALVATLAASFPTGASAQLQGGANWDNDSKQFNSSGGLPGAPAGARNTSLDALNRILSASQLPPLDRSVYLSIRAFQLTRLGREADSQKDITEMGKLLPNGWQIVLSSTQPDLAGGGDRAAALRILDYGLSKKPNDSWLMVAQAQVNMQLADFAKALGLLDRAVAGAQTAGERRSALFYRGHANFNLANFTQSAADFEASLDGLTTLKSKLARELWRYAAMVHTRQDARGALNRAVGNENLYEWPGPIAKFLLGKLPAGELEVAAESDAEAKRTNGKCPAAFFAGMDAQRAGNKQRAREQLQLAQARCPTVSELNWAASSELKRL
jgi:tetratricopeptide (TPR) repeat protein